MGTTMHGEAFEAVPARSWRSACVCGHIMRGAFAKPPQQAQSTRSLGTPVRLRMTTKNKQRQKATSNEER